MMDLSVFSPYPESPRMRIQEFSIETPLISGGVIGIHGDEVRYHGSSVESGDDITEIVKRELE